MINILICDDNKEEAEMIHKYKTLIKITNIMHLFLFTVPIHQKMI